MQLTSVFVGGALLIMVSFGLTAFPVEAAAKRLFRSAKKGQTQERDEDKNMKTEEI
jgi:hypothetical protein